MSNFRIYNQSLCPALWDSQQHLDPEVRLNLLKMAKDFYEKTGFQAPIIDVYLMGSIANYNWTADSDADVHVIIDYNQLQMPEETSSEVIKTAGAQWNTEHNATVKGHKVELNIQNAREQKPHVTGIYSLMKDQWIRQPQYQPRQFDTPTIQAKYKGMKKYIEAALRSGNRDTMKSAKKYLDAFRQYGLDTGGELSIENIVFKIIRSKGLIKALKTAITATYDKEMSVKEVGMKDLKQSLPREPRQYQYQDDGKLRLDKLNLDQLAALRAKCARGIAYLKSGKGGEAFGASLQQEMDEFARITKEIRRRMNYINKPVAVPEGYGAGDPTKDPKARGRWTVDFESSSKFLKEIAEVPRQPRSPQELFQMIAKQKQDAIESSPVINDPIEGKRLIRTNMIEASKAVKLFLSSTVGKEWESANHAAEFIGNVISQSRAVLQRWGIKALQSNPDNREQVRRQYQDTIAHIEQISAQISTIYATLQSEEDARIEAYKQAKHLGEIINRTIESSEALIDMASGKGT